MTLHKNFSIDSTLIASLNPGNGTSILFAAETRSFDLALLTHDPDFDDGWHSTIGKAAAKAEQTAENREKRSAFEAAASDGGLLSSPWPSR